MIKYQKKIGEGRDKKGEHLFLDSAYVGYDDVIYNMCRLVQIKKYHPEFTKM